MGENIYVLYLIEMFWNHRTVEGGGNTKWEREWKDDCIYANPPSFSLLSCAKIFSLLRNLSFIFTIWPYEGRILNLILRIICTEKLLGIARNKSLGSCGLALQSVVDVYPSGISPIFLIRSNFYKHVKWSEWFDIIKSINCFTTFILVYFIATPETLYILKLCNVKHKAYVTKLYS